MASDLFNRSRQGQVPLLHSSSRSDPGITGLAGLGVRNMMDGIQASMVMCCKDEDREITNQKIKEMVAKKKSKN